MVRVVLEAQDSMLGRRGRMTAGPGSIVRPPLYGGHSPVIGLGQPCLKRAAAPASADVRLRMVSPARTTFGQPRMDFGGRTLPSVGPDRHYSHVSRKVPLPVAVEADGVSRYPQEVEAAIYFCVLEALQNVAKYSGAAYATVRLSEAGGYLAVEVTNDGAGFDERDRQGAGARDHSDGQGIGFCGLPQPGQSEVTLQAGEETVVVVAGPVLPRCDSRSDRQRHDRLACPALVEGDDDLGPPAPNRGGTALFSHSSPTERGQECVSWQPSGVTKLKAGRPASS
jgi:hypothetical protein